MSKRSPTTKDIGLLHQLFKNNQLTLAPEFQRNAIWPRAAKVYLIDTILNDRPIPLLFFQRAKSPQSGLQSYSVIDGQQRLRAIFEFLDNKLRLSAGKGSPRRSYQNKKFSELSESYREQILNYDLVIEELSGYSEKDIRDMFVRINRYVVQLSPQELRHAKGSGKFHDFVEQMGRESFWKAHKVFSQKMIARMRAVEFAAELTILLIEGAQDKKSSIDLYYENYKSKFPEAKKIGDRLKLYLTWIAKAVPELGKTRFRKPVDLYSLIGALDRASNEGKHLSKIKHERVATRLLDLEERMKVKFPSGTAARYLAAASRQTDNLIPRTTRIEILENLLRT
jgi:hypothetical protein